MLVSRLRLHRFDSNPHHHISQQPSQFDEGVTMAGTNHVKGKELQCAANHLIGWCTQFHQHKRTQGEKSSRIVPRNKNTKNVEDSANYVEDQTSKVEDCACFPTRQHRGMFSMGKALAK